MNYQNIVQPVDFSALFQLSLTLCAAYIAIEYTKSFTAQVINNFYNFKDEIGNRIADCMRLCRNEEMQNIDSDDYFKVGDGLCLVDDYRKKHKECEAKSNELSLDLNDYVDMNTEYRIFRHISIFMMFFCFAFLVSCGLYRIYPSQVIHFLLSFATLTILFIIAGWTSAVFRATQSWSESRSISLTIISFIIIVIASFTSLSCHPPLPIETKELIWLIGMVLAVILPYLNFVFFFLLVTFQMGKLQEYCEQRYYVMKKECNEAGELMVKILNHQEMRNRIDEHKKEQANSETECRT